MQDTKAPDLGTAAFLRDLRTAPNVVSLARVVLVYIAIALLHRQLWGVGLAIGIVAGLSDYLDGYLARRLKQTTRIGAMLDQAADILFITGCLYVFVRDDTWPSLLLYVMLFRETVVLCLRATAAQMGFSLPSIFLGKFASNCLFYALALMGAARGHLLPEPYNTWTWWLATFGVYLGTASSVLTATIYFRSWARQYRPLPRQDAR